MALFSELRLSLRTGAQARNHVRRTLLGIRKLTDVRIPTRDPQVHLLADIFLPIDGDRYPVVLAATKYGKTFGRGCACTATAALEAEKIEDELLRLHARTGPETASAV